MRDTPKIFVGNKIDLRKPNISPQIKKESAQKNLFEAFRC